MSRMPIILMLLCLLGAIDSARAELKVTWVGQVEQDVVGPFFEVKPSDTQDLQIRLEGLAADKEIENVRIVRQGGGEWQVNGPSGVFAAVMQRQPGSTQADVFVEPTHNETGRIWEVTVRYADGTTEGANVETGTSDKKLRMPDAVLKAEWIGQDGRDWTGPSAAVGPDGIQDVALKISGLSDKLGILNSIRIEAEGGPVWEYGHNPEKVWNAELFRESPKSRTAELLISPPPQSLDGKPLKVIVYYGYNRDHRFEGTGTAGPSQADLKTPAPKQYDVRKMPSFSANWLGQDGGEVTGRGDVHVRITGLPTHSPVVAAALSDSVVAQWAWRANDEVEFHTPTGAEYVPPTRALGFRPDAADPSAADLHFQPLRNEQDARMTFRVMLADGSMHFGQFDGQACDPYLRGKLPNDKVITAQPGDDLHALVKEYGRINLAPGIHRLTRKLELTEPVTISGPREAVLMFKQPEEDEKWNEAIQILADNVTLEGFSLRFDGPVRWAIWDWTLGCGIIRARLRPDRTGDLVNLIIRNMDIEGSAVGPIEDPSKPEWIPNLIRTGRILNGKIIGNTFRGGTVDVSHGPWIISDNVHLGATENGVTWDAFATHYSWDVTVERNKLHADQTPGKLWRFLVLTQWSTKSVVRDNDVRGVGKRDNDPMPNPNAPEILLTEAYRLHYEGQIRQVSADGYVAQIPFTMWSEPRAGAIIAILDGEHAGKWFRIAQPIDNNTFLMDQPMPAGSYTVSVATAMVDELFENNRIDVRGGKSDVIQLCGTTFNTIVRNNHVLGGRIIKLKAPPTEFPGCWGWSLCPVFDMVIEGNTFEDMRGGVVLETHHSKKNTKSVPGRLYQTMVARNNTVRWTPAFATWYMANETSEKAKKDFFYVPLEAIRLGAPDSPAPGDFRISLEDNKVITPSALREAAGVFVRKAIVNGEPLVDQKLPLATEVIDAEARNE